MDINWNLLQGAKVVFFTKPLAQAQQQKLFFVGTIQLFMDKVVGSRLPFVLFW